MRFMVISLLVIIVFFIHAYSLQTKNDSNNQLYDQLLRAIRTNNEQDIIKVIALYKQKGINLDSYRDSTQATPLMYAAYLGNKNAVKILLSEGANPKAQDLIDQISLDYAKKSLYEIQKRNDAKKIDKVNDFYEIMKLLQN